MDDIFGRQSVVAHVGALGDGLAKGGETLDATAPSVAPAAGTPVEPPPATAASFTQASEKYEVVGPIVPPLAMFWAGGVNATEFV